MGRFTEANMSNVLKVAVPSGVTTQWAPQLMGEVAQEQAWEAQEEFRFYLEQHAHFAWARVLIEEYEADPTRVRLKTLEWHLSNPKTRMTLR